LAGAQGASSASGFSKATGKRLRDPGPFFEATMKRGFSLAELAVVLVILGMALSVILPRIGGVSDGERLKTAARRVAGLAREAHSEAAVTSRPMFLAIDLDKRRMWLSDVRPGKEGQAGRQTRFVNLPMGVIFEDVFHPAKDQVKEGRVSFGYWPQGGSEPGTIHMMNQNDEESVLTIFLRPFLGRAEIEPGYLREDLR
jgi:prepilin-type N-terminal cleavage/methylation domain-containing protein